MNSEGGGVAVDREHLDDARHLHRFGGIEALDLAAQHRRTRNDRIQHPGQAGVDAELRLAVDDDRPVGERGVVLADVAELRRILQLQRLARRHVELGRGDGERAVAQPATARLVDDLVVPRLDLVERHAAIGWPRPARASAAPPRRSGASARTSAACCASRRCPGCRTWLRRPAPARRARACSRLPARRPRSAAGWCGRPGPFRSG